MCVHTAKFQEGLKMTKCKLNDEKFILIFIIFFVLSIAFFLMYVMKAGAYEKLEGDYIELIDDYYDLNKKLSTFELYIGETDERLYEERKINQALKEQMSDFTQWLIKISEKCEITGERK